MKVKSMPTTKDWAQITHDEPQYQSKEDFGHGYEYQYIVDSDKLFFAVYNPFAQNFKIWRAGTLYINKKAKGKNVDWANKQLCKFLKIMGKDFENPTHFKPKPVTSKIEVCNVDYFQFNAKMIDSFRVVFDAYKDGTVYTLIASKEIKLGESTGTLDDHFNYFVRKTLTKQGYCPDDFVLQEDGAYQYPIAREVQEDMPPVFDEINEAYQNIVDNPEAAAERVREQVQGKKALEPSITFLAQIQMLTLTVSFGEHLTVPIVEFFHSLYDDVYIGNGTRGTVQHLTLDGSTGFVGNIQTVEYYSDGSFKIV